MPGLSAAINDDKTVAFKLCRYIVDKRSQV